MVQLGSSAVTVSQLGFGAMGLTAFYGSPVTNEHGINVMMKA